MLVHRIIIEIKGNFVLIISCISLCPLRSRHHNRIRNGRCIGVAEQEARDSLQTAMQAWHLRRRDGREKDWGRKSLTTAQFEERFGKANGKPQVHVTCWRSNTSC